MSEKVIPIRGTIEEIRNEGLNPAAVGDLYEALELLVDTALITIGGRLAWPDSDVLPMDRALRQADRALKKARAK